MRVAPLMGMCAVLAAGACEKARVQNLTAPSPPLPSTSDLAISGLPLVASVGQSVQLSASLTLPDGRRKIADAQWRSSDNSIATISTTGVLSFVGRGAATITAGVLEQSASAHVRVPFTIAGFVREGAVTGNVPVVGARAMVQGGVDAGTSTFTDGSGRFSLQVEAAGFNVIVSSDGYDSASVPIVELPRDESPVVTLSANGMVTDHFAGALCADADYYHRGYSDYVRPCVTAPVAGHHIIELHRGGTIGLVLRWTYQEDYSDEYMYLNVSCGQYQVEQRYSFSAGPGTLTFPVPSAGSCDISPNRYASFKGIIAQTTYKIDVVHPR